VLTGLWWRKPRRDVTLFRYARHVPFNGSGHEPAGTHHLPGTFPCTILGAISASLDLAVADVTVKNGTGRLLLHAWRRFF
jgi:hypothetical protein